VSTTSDVFFERSSAVFDVTQYAGDGRRLAHANVVAVVAG
jgi:hypothetical protein